MQGFKLSLRRTTNVTTLTDSQLIPRSVDYMKFLITTIPEIALGKTLPMERTAVFLMFFKRSQSILKAVSMLS